MGNVDCCRCQMAGEVSRMTRGRRGSIYRIALENFVTYKQVELFPGPNLNLLIGPNGTGKSTFICAIVLGLSGKTSVLGRAKKIGEYVRCGCTEATIEIALFNGKSTTTITRRFNTENTTVWSIDGKPAKEKDVHELVETLNIRVDNLCQLLPQDRVQDFAKMNPQELLKSTQLAIDGQEVVTTLESLIDSKVAHRNTVAKMNSNILQLNDHERTNERLEAIIASMEQEKKIREEIGFSDKKKAWLEYENLKMEVGSIKVDRSKAMKQLKTDKDKIAPLLKEHNLLENENSKLEEKKRESSAAVFLNVNKIKKLLEKSETCNSKIVEAQNDWKIKLAHKNEIHQEIEQTKLNLMKLINDRDHLLKTNGDEKTLNENLQQIHKPIQAMNAKLNSLKEEKNNCQYEIHSRVSPQLRLCRNRLSELGNADNKRMEVLKNFNEDTFNAVNWLRENKQLFSENVYEPMMLELNFSDPKYAKYLENTVARRDLLAFTFENSDDMNLFLRKVRGEMQLKMVNAVCSSAENNNFESQFEINHLKPLGFLNYLVNLVSGPAPIINFLCNQYNIHKIPVGNDKTYKMSDKVPEQITYFFSENHRFTTRISKYSGAKSTSTNEISPAQLLAVTIDHETMKNIKEQLNVLTSRQQEIMESISNANLEITNYEDKLNSAISKRQKLCESLEQVKTILSRIRMQQNAISNLENQQTIDIEEESKKYSSEIEKHVNEQCSIQKQIYDLLNNLQKEIVVVDYIKLILNAKYQVILENKTKIANLQSQAANTEQIIACIDDRLSAAKSVAKEKLLEAKSLTGQYLPHEKEFPYGEEFDKLPSTINELDDHIAMLQAKAQCIDDCDPGAMEDYKKRQKQILSLQEEIKKLKKREEIETQNMIKLKDKWLVPLEEQIFKINQKFGDMFSQLGCAGEVRLSKDAADDDYDKYGISILVRFRNEEKLQQLTRHVQSGGERAISTALYLMALQQLSKAPFRCVDEINQGMDPINERKMFQLLVKVTTECDASSQYFILSPKLLFGLEYTPSIKVHTIMNGPRAIKYSKWNLKEFVKKGRNVSL